MFYDKKNFKKILKNIILQINQYICMYVHASDMANESVNA